MRFLALVMLLVVLSCGSKEDMIDDPMLFHYTSLSIDGQDKFVANGVRLNPVIKVGFTEPLDYTSVSSAIHLAGIKAQEHKTITTLENKDSTISILFSPPLFPLTNYKLSIDNTLKTISKKTFSTTLNVDITTGIDSLVKFPSISDDSLLTIIQKKTFAYFWEFGHPTSGLARERNASGDVVTSGGSGFGIMSIIVAMERGFITREQGLERIDKIVSFLGTKAERFHGAFSHWLDGQTGKAVPFSQKDDGGDLVETSYLMAGLLCAKEYFDQADPAELKVRNGITRLWEEVEWNWYTKGEKVLYWHWSPKYQWEMNHQIKGWNEALITYILAASSPTYPIASDVYHSGWASGGGMLNGQSYFNISLPLGPALGGPLFFEHYTFLGINPKNLKDQYADYNIQTVHHSLINYNYCVQNMKQYYGYSNDCWGLTASDTRNGYTAHSPTNDQGVITPTAALSSLPFTPEESMKAIRFFYYFLGDRILGEYGFMDAFSLHYAWFSNTYLAIDQGPIIVMIENHRSGLIWNTTMKNTDIQNGLKALNFSY